MALKFGKSEIFELTAAGGASFYIHKDILASQSAPFREATNGVWKDATERKLSLSDWDEDTVARLVQYLYTDDYEFPDPAPLSAPTSGPTSPMTLQIVIEEDRADITRPLTPLSEWILKEPAPKCPSKNSNTAKVTRFDPASHDFKGPLLAHAQVYALAQYKSISALRSLAYRRLLLTLSHLHPLPPASHLCRNLVDLASYGYPNTDALSSLEEPLRKLISQFTALNFTALQTEPEAVELLGSGGDYVKDVMKKLCRRLVAGVYEGEKVAGPGTRFVSGLRVVNGGAPPSHVVELRGSSANINHPHPSGTWIVLEFTTEPSKACTAFQLSFVAEGHAAANNLAVHEGTQCYLVPSKEQGNNRKITGVALVRFDDNLAGSPSIKGYDGMTGDIKKAWAATDNLHLAWKTVKVA